MSSAGVHPEGTMNPPEHVVTIHQTVAGTKVSSCPTSRRA